jgi:hypothetical protein
MAEQWIGIVASGSQLKAVHLEIDGNNVVLSNQFTWKLQSGDEALAYAAMYDRVKGYVENNAVQNVVIKASAVGKNKPTLAHLKSAELRGVICVASVAGGASTTLIQKGTVSRTFGDRKVDEYVKDDSFWDNHVVGELTKGRREAALLVLSQRS